MTEQEKREKVIKGLKYLHDVRRWSPDESEESITARRNITGDALALLKAQEPITGETSDGYHTFNELYHHRAVLFSVIVANYPDRAWKSKKHHDGTMYDGMFIVGIETPDGQATYHYDIDPYWDMFKCRALDNAPEWDGHTPAQAIERIGKLRAQEPVVMAGAELTDAELIEKIRKAPITLKPAVDAVPVVHGRWIDENPYDSLDPRMRCSICTGVESPLLKWRYCPNCGARMDGERRESE